jgi:hypothetical protein
MLEMSKISSDWAFFPMIEREPSIFPLKPWGIRPLIQWASVDFPDPEGPRISIFSPRPIVKLIPYRVGSAWDA